MASSLNSLCANSIPGNKSATEFASEINEKNDEETETLSFADELKQGQTENSENDIVVVGIIGGIVAVAIIGGIILKLKKN